MTLQGLGLCLQKAHPGMGVPTLSPSQAAMMQKGLSELVQMRRKGLKAQKHSTSVVPLPISLEKLNSGCIRTVSRYVKNF